MRFPVKNIIHTYKHNTINKLKIKKMKNIILILIAISIFGCSSDDNSKNANTAIPEKFDIKVEIKSLGGSSPSVHVSINSEVKKQWSNVKFPFEGLLTYYTTGNEINNTACKCIEISSWAYISKIDNIESFNLYVDGKLVDSKKVPAASEPSGIMNPTTLKFVYNP